MKNIVKEIEKISLYKNINLLEETKTLLETSKNYKEKFLDVSNFVWLGYLKYLNRVPDPTGYFGHINNLLISNIDKDTFVYNLQQSEEYKAKNKIPEINDTNFVVDYINNNKSNVLSGFSVKIYAPFGTSGYSDAVLDYIYAIIMNGGVVSFVPTDLQGKVDSNTAKNIKYQIALSCMNLDIEVDNVWIYTTPIVWEPIVKVEKSRNSDVKTYGMYIWETDNLRAEVIEGMNNSVDIVLAPSEYNIGIFKKYITKPLYCLHHVIRQINPNINEDIILKNDFLSNLKKLSEENFIFYVIAHWNPRKDLDNLLNAFDKAFTSKDNVKLVVKTFLHSHGKENNTELQTYINSKYDNKNILLNFELMTIDEIQELHKICHCFVSTSHSEGVGFSVIIAAMLNQVLAPKFSGYMDYVKDVTPIKFSTINVDLNYPPLFEGFEKFYSDYKTDMKWIGIDPDDLITQLGVIRNNTKENNINKIFTANTFSYNNIVGEILGIFDIDNVYQNTLGVLEKFINQNVELNTLRSYVKTLEVHGNIEVYEKAVIQIRDKYNIPEMHYVFQYFKSDNPERQYEMDFCLENILINPFITKVHCLSEKEYNFTNLYLSNKINQQVIGCRLTFKKAFDYCNSNLPRQICLFANNDIYFDSTLYYITQLASIENFFIALSRHDYNINTHGLNSFNITNDGVHEYSQDVWVFKTPIPTNNEMEFFQGVQGCDNRIAYLFDRLGYFVINPCETITITHMHTSEVRNVITNSKDTRFKTNLKSIRSTNIATINNILKLFQLYFNRKPSVEEFSNILLEVEIYKKEIVVDLKTLRNILIFIIDDRSYDLIVDILNDNNVTITPELKILFDGGVDIPIIIEKCMYDRREYLVNNVNSIVSACNKNILSKEEKRIELNYKSTLKNLILCYKGLDEAFIKEKLRLLFKNKFKYNPGNDKINLMYNLYLELIKLGTINERIDNLVLLNIADPREIIENAFRALLGRSVDYGSLNKHFEELEKLGVEGFYKYVYNSEEYKNLGKDPYISKVKKYF